MFVNSLSGRFLLLTTLFVMLAEILIFVPSIAGFRQDYLLLRLERAQIASLSLLENDMITEALEAELLETAGVYNVVLRRDNMRQLVLRSEIPDAVSQTYDLRDASFYTLIRDALLRLFNGQQQVIRVIGKPVHEAGLSIEVTMSSTPLRGAMIDYGVQVLILSAVISVITALLLFVAVRGFLLRPIHRVVRQIKSYAAAPQDARLVITPSANVQELREAEEALQTMQTELSSSLKQKERLAQMGGAVAKISHDLRNILTTTQLFADRMETSNDPAVQRAAPKLVNSLSRAVKLCETTLAFGRAEEAPPSLADHALLDIVTDVFEAERLALEQGEVTYHHNITPDLVLRVDAEQLYRVISNLVGNARQAIVASKKPGEITVRGQEQAENWIITITDTGPGLPAKAREHLFTPFQGGVRKGGSGLGLSIAAELVRGHGGALELLRSDEHGTVFEIRLPRGEMNLDAI